MYATACKMNHSCDPNVIVLYKRTGWGPQHPLTAYCVALRDIHNGEELTISYIDKGQSYEERVATLVNYGFTCTCNRCQREKAEGTTKLPAVRQKDNGVAFIHDKGVESNAIENGAVDTDPADEGETLLQQRLERLDTTANHCQFGAVPLNLLAPVSTYIDQKAADVLSQWENNALGDRLQQCLDAMRERDHCMCRIVGCDLTDTLYSLPSAVYREPFWCSSLTAVAGCAHECSFLEAMGILDRALILGLPRDDDRLDGFINYIEHHASEMATGPYPSAVSSDELCLQLQ
jgi:SET domain